jgi:hypothetical protein
VDNERLDLYESWLKIKDALVNLFKKVFDNLLKRAINIWTEIEKFTRQYSKRIPVPTKTWPRQSVITMRTQVINRKPMMVRARTYC